MQVINSTISDSKDIVRAAVEQLKAGGLIIFPTETTYGAGVDATNQAAVNKLLAYKSRREGKPLSIAVTDEAMAAQYVEVNDQARKLYAQFLPGPVTVISKSKGVVAHGVESEFGTLGVRIPDYQLVLDIVKELGRPMTATSANGSGEKRPYTIQDIFDGLSDKQKSLLDLVIDAGTLPPNPPSTVIDTTLSTPVVFRQGEKVLGTGSKVQGARSKALELISQSEQETKDIAKRVLLKNWNEIKETGLIVGLDGSLGVGKTIFTKGVADFLFITDTITSPTYTYIEEYDFARHNITGQLYHLDLWKIQSAEELGRLELPTLFKANNVVVVEWFSQVKEWLEPMIQDAQIPVVEITLTQAGSARKLVINE